MDNKNRAHLLGKFTCPLPVNCLTWEAHQNYAMGLVTAGLIDGSLLMIDPEKVLDGEST